MLCSLDERIWRQKYISYSHQRQQRERHGGCFGLFLLSWVLSLAHFLPSLRFKNNSHGENFIIIFFLFSFLNENARERCSVNKGKNVESNISSIYSSKIHNVFAHTYVCIYTFREVEKSLKIHLMTISKTYVHTLGTFTLFIQPTSSSQPREIPTANCSQWRYFSLNCFFFHLFLRLFLFTHFARLIEKVRERESKLNKSLNLKKEMIWRRRKTSQILLVVVIAMYHHTHTHPYKKLLPWRFTSSSSQIVEMEEFLLYVQKKVVVIVVGAALTSF